MDRDIHFRILAETASDAIITIDRDSTILFVNPAIERIFGHAPEALLGRKLTLLMPDYLRRLHEAAVHRYADTGVAHISWTGIELPGLHARGHTIDLEVTFGEWRQDGEHRFTGIVRDVSVRKRLERRRAAQYELSRVLAETPALRDAAPQVLEALALATGWDLGELWIPAADGAALEPAGAWAARPDEAASFLATGRATRFAPGEGLPGLAWERREWLVVEDVTSDARFVREAAAAEVGLRSAIAFPVLAEDAVVGVLAFYSHELRERGADPRLDEDLAQMMTSATQQLAVYLERERAHDERRRLLEALRRERERLAELNAQLERRVEERTAQLEAMNRELESFNYSVSHDLRAPLRGIDGFSQVLREDYGDRLDEAGLAHLDRVRDAANRMGALIDDLLELSRLTRDPLEPRPVDLSGLAAEVAAELRERDPERCVRCEVEPGLVVDGDERLLRVALENLLENAWKFTAGRADARVGVRGETRDGELVVVVEDNGAGFDMTYADKLFVPFQRLHAGDGFAGTGIGLATVQRIVQRHGGRIWAEGEPEAGARFYLALAQPEDDPGGPSVSSSQ